jgi:homoserine dehydrogenase
MDESFALYVHVPWCRHVCPYCDFNVYVEPGLRAGFVEAVDAELALATSVLGPGAGQMPTASAVVGDLINLASALRLPDFAPYFQPAIDANEAPLCSIEDSESAFYIRLETEDTPGVIGNIGHALGDHLVSVHSLLQRGVPHAGPATIILLTHSASERNVARAIEEIEAQGSTRQVGVVLRVFE